MDRKRTRLESELCTAVNNGEPRSVELLLSQGARPDLVGRKGVAAIHLAVGKETEKNTRCLKMLLQHGADPNIRSSEGLTPLHIAALWGCYGNLKLLLMNGGNPNMKDNDGKTPRQLAEQQDNRKCAQLLQDHLASSADTEDDDLPQFQYSFYADHTDTSSYPLSDYSFSSQSSMMSDFGEGALSSTRRSSFFNLSNINGRPGCKGTSHHRRSDVDADRRSRHWSASFHWASEGRSILSSTRMSAVPVIEEDDSCADDRIIASRTDALSATTDDRMSPSQRGTLPPFLSRRASRKSVSFCDVDEYFPVFSPESPQRQPAADGCSTLPFDLSEYSSFLDSERMATVLHRQGIDVTSPDHVYVYCRESSESTEEELEKTVMSHCAVEDDDEDVVKEAEGNHPDQKSHPSGSSSSQYSSCDSDHYTSALDASVHTRSSVCDDAMKKADSRVLIAQTEAPLAVECDLFGKLSLSEGDRVPSEEVEAFNGPIASGKDEADEPVADVQSEDLPFTPSPFVTGRTRSRMSRCSLRESSTLEKLFTSSLFDETLPTPVRSQRQTPRSQRADDFYSSPQAPCYTQLRSGRGPQSDAFASDWQDSQTSTVTAGTSLADTLILPQGASGSAASQSLCETVILEENQDSSVDAYEKHIDEVMLAMQGLHGDGGFLTDEVTSTDEAPTEEHLTGVCDVAKKDDVWISEDCSSQPDSVSNVSSSSCVSPKRSRDDSDPPCTPGTGCTPRYSMSRLSSHSRPHQLANLSYTPGGRPHIPDTEEPVEYLYTDTEEGHELIETHVPPTANTSLSSREDSGDDTILYDWRAMHDGGKENQKPQEEKESESISGITDRDLRLRLLELGESPGPISRHTRPTYMKRLRRLLQESNSTSSNSTSSLDQRQSEEPSPDSSFSPELNLALRTFRLPECQLDEQALSQQFDQPDQNRKWREGIVKSSFNYLLLDPRVTKNLPFRSQTMTPHECFRTFVRAIFYVGKGKRSRPYSHLYEALEYYRGDKTSKKLCRKVQHILQVWNAEQGVISLHCFQNVIPVEAYTREACMVEAIGLKMLTNQKRGDFYGVVSNWQVKRRRELGVHLLYRAMQIFLAEGERQLRPADIRQ